jgi:phosphoribosylaminoimidazolecarboxamide formyltransferase/IMP cyclohydrolase
MNLIPIKRVLISVSDKTEIVEFAKQLQRWDVEIISTGGTLKTLNESGINALSISEVTGFPEILNGRVKTLHPKIHAALLAISDNPNHQKQLEELRIEPIEMVIVNLYPFEQTIAKESVSLDEAIEQIDIGGPSMLRAAAKNYKYKVVVSDPGQYRTIISEMEANNGSITEKTRFQFAKEVFLLTSKYDSAIANYLTNLDIKSSPKILPAAFSITLPKTVELRYGENPHQQAALYGNFKNIFRNYRTTIL